MATTEEQPAQATTEEPAAMATTEEQPLQIQPTKRRVVRTKLLGMIWNANYVLEQALSPNTKEIPRELFQKCTGVVIMAITKAGFLFTGHCGTGVMMAKVKKDDPDAETEWSNPVGVYNGGYSFGPVLGYKQDNYITFLFDDESLRDFADRPQSRIGLVASCTLCKSGGEFDRGMNQTFKGQDSICVVISKGAFAGGALEMETFETAMERANNDFYGRKVHIAKILFEKDSVVAPGDSLIPDLHRKLRMLERGETWVPGDLDRSRSGHFYVLSEKAEKEAEASKNEGKEAKVATKEEEKEEV